MTTVTPLTTSYWQSDSALPLLNTTVGGLLQAAATDAPDAPALVEGSGTPDARRWTYRELYDESEAVARVLLSRFSPGERVAVWAPGIPEWVLLEFGAALAGMVLVTVNPALRPQEVAYVLRQSRAAGVYLVPEIRGASLPDALATVRDQLPELREALLLTDLRAETAAISSAEPLPPVLPDDPAQIQYTSGTTGFPKGALLHHRGIVNNAHLVADRAGLDADGSWLNPMPLFHTGGCVLGALGPVTKRAAHIPVAMFDPALVLRLAEEHRATLLAGVPTMLIAEMEHPDFATRDLSSLRMVVSGGSQVPPEVVRRVEQRLGIPCTIVFGQTESSPVITQTWAGDTDQDRAETVGRALPHTEVKVIDTESGETVPFDVVGEICTRGYHVMLGYNDMPDATGLAIDGDGWLRTGDLGTMDDRGYVRVTGRLKDMIIRGGENIYPTEIEAVLHEDARVGSVAVLGLPDELWGERVAAVVRPAPGATVDVGELFALVRDRLAPHKTPRVWSVVDELPLTASGKIQKFVLQERMARGELPSTEL